VNKMVNSCLNYLFCGDDLIDLTEMLYHD